MERVERKLSPEERENIRVFFGNYPRIAAVYLFGSYGTEFQLPTSDLDLGIIFCQAVDLREELEVDAELSEYLHTDKIDFVNLARTPVSLQYKALKEGELLRENNYTVHSDFLETVFKQYWDYRISHDRFMRDYDVALKEVYSGG